MYSWVVKTQSAKICLNFNFQAGGGLFLGVKIQTAKTCLYFNFWGGVFLGSKNSKCQDLSKFQLGGGWYSWVVKTQKLPISGQLFISGGGSILCWE